MTDPLHTPASNACGDRTDRAWFSRLVRHPAEWVYSYNPGACMGQKHPDSTTLHQGSCNHKPNANLTLSGPQPKSNHFLLITLQPPKRLIKMSIFLVMLLLTVDRQTQGKTSSLVEVKKSILEDSCIPSRLTITKPGMVTNL